MGRGDVLNSNGLLNSDEFAFKMKRKLQDLHKDIQADVSSLTSELIQTINDLGDRTIELQNKMDDMTDSQNLMREKQKEPCNVAVSLEQKFADLQDKKRRNNTRIKMKPGKIPPVELEVLERAPTDFDMANMVIDRIHTLPKRRYAPATVSKDITDMYELLHT
ncbi:Hypothetical predicted protein [Pelobates cultripes]|uniref:Uncharacterized protein n=1 Tax=Pelobates cultripes TaxID=61616 RepID=A0AAD1T293_PELCU|nr:Hypothetical predicted protein [Pelobates cultripes]